MEQRQDQLKDGILNMSREYNAAMKGDWNPLKDFYRGAQSKPVTLILDTVLHIVAHSQQPKLMKYLITKVSRVALNMQNDVGNTVLYEAAISGDLEMAKVVFKAQREMLKEGNVLGETPLFGAAAYGHTQTVQYLAKQFKKSSESPSLGRSDGTSILHIAILGQYLDTALELLKLYPDDLVSRRDENGLTGLHLLASMPLTFRSGCNMSFPKKLIYSCIPTVNDETADPDMSDLETGLGPHGEEQTRPLGIACSLRRALHRINVKIWDCLSNGWSAIHQVCEEKNKHALALRLVKKLVAGDKSWMESHNGGDPHKITVRSGKRPQSDQHVMESSPHFFSNPPSEPPQVTDHIESTHQDISNSPSKPPQVTDHIESTHQDISNPPYEPHTYLNDESTPHDHSNAPSSRSTQSKETPLLMAAGKGIVEIVEEILAVFPQAVEHVNDEGLNILHVAAQNRQAKIFKLICTRDTIPMIRLSRRLDKDGNSVLHQAAKRNEKNPQVDHLRNIPGEALQLQWEIQWFKQVKEVMPPHFRNHLNDDEEKADEVFTECHKELAKNGEKWLMRTANSCSLVATLIATVAFTSAYTVPGGPNQNTGHPVLLNHPAFLFFTVSDTISLSFALTSVVVFLSIMTSPFHEQDFHLTLPFLLVIGLTSLFLAVSAMMVSFAATLVLMITQKLRRAAIPIYLVACFPVTIFLVLQFPLYVRVAWYTIGDILIKFRRSFSSHTPTSRWSFKEE